MQVQSSEPGIANYMGLNRARAKILVVDDDEVALEVLRGMLENDYQVVVADNGAAALSICHSFDPPDLVLLDIMMPGMDGYEVIRRLKADEGSRRIPIIFVTAMVEAEDELRGFNLGAADYLTKPVSSARVMARVATHLELKQQRDRMEALVEERTEELSQVRQTVAAKDALLRDLFGAMDELLANRDHYTFEHALRVAEISKRVGIELGVPEEELQVLELGCLVHDIGKVAIPDDILLKPGRFDLEDRRIMEFHPLIGARLFAKRLHDDRITMIILHHHERLDGSGYPYGLKEDEIGMLVRIVGVADIYEALVARRPYKHPMTREKALLILHQDAAAGKLDGAVVAALEKITSTWDPLSITRDFTAAYTNNLEVFRRKTYFREPLTDFYNYRYLLFLDSGKFIRCQSEHYHLLMIDFMKLRDLNTRVGYIKADQIIDEIGMNLFKTVERINENLLPHGKQIMLFRKGADYLIHADLDAAELRELVAEIEEQLKIAGSEWGVMARFIRRDFLKNRPVEEAINEIFQG